MNLRCPSVDAVAPAKNPTVRMLHDQPPPAGEFTSVAQGLQWARLPLPFRLDHVNVWLFEEDDGWTAIDSGCATPATFDIWALLFAGPMRGRPITRLIITHSHIDHIGLGGWLCERFGAPLLTTSGEWRWAKAHHVASTADAEARARRFMLRHGFQRDEADAIAGARGGFAALACPLPASATIIRDGEILRLGGRDWRVIVTPGHAPEHASFYCEAMNILIAGDHLLPKISPVIAVFEDEPDANPLAAYLASFERFADLPDDVVVLPSHGLPYVGLHARIAELKRHHEERLATIVAMLAQPMNARDLSAAVFGRFKHVNDKSFALAEMVAHLNLLLADGAIEAVDDDEGVRRYRRVG